jgi:3-hydroxybutyryl-CoA dehydratase
MMRDPATFKYDEIAVGATDSFSVTVNEKMVNDFAQLTGDENPLHTDAAYAEETKFGGRVAHGMLIGGLFSQLIGMHLPGKYSLYLSQALQFRNPVMIGAKVLIRGEVTHKSDASKTITLKMTATDENAKVIFASGDAVVQLLK